MEMEATQGEEGKVTGQIAGGEVNNPHLPECSESMIPDFHNERWICICAPLRACEQRVREEIDREAFLLDEGDPFRQVYRKGLDAAREAVEGASSLLQPLGPALAAIDALREEKP